MTALSVLKNVLCLNKNQIHVDKIEDKVEVLHKDEDVSKGKGKVEFLDKADAEARRAVGGEVFIARDVILIHARPYKRVQCVCPIWKKKCSGYDTPHDTESRWRAPNLHGVSVYVGYVRKRINCFLFQVLFSDRLGSHSDILGIYFDILGSDFNRLGKFSVFGNSPGGWGKFSDLQLRYGPGC